MTKQIFPVQNGRAQYQPRTERRAWVRYPKDHEIWCQPQSNADAEEADTAWLGKVRDISCVGMGLSMSRRFEPGTPLVVEWSEKPQAVLRFLHVRVVHATRTKDRRWLIGCEFISPFSQQDLQALLEQ